MMRPLRLMRAPAERARPDVVSKLRRALHDADSGCVRAIGLVTVRSDGGVTTCYSAESSSIELLGGAEMLRTRIAKAIMDADQ